MIRTKANLPKSIPLFFLLFSVASLASAEPEKRGFREEIQQMAQTAQAASRSDRPAANADRGRDGDRDRDGRRGGHHRGNDGRGRRHDVDRGRDGHRDGRRHDADRGRRDGRRNDQWQSDRNRGSWGNDGRQGRHDRYDRHDRRDRHDRWDRHDRRHDRRWDGPRHGHHRHRSWDHGFRGHRAWHESHLRNGFYFRTGRYVDWFFDVPSFLTIDYDPRFEEYYYGSVFHPGYGRDFEVFLFPRYYHDRVEYVPYAYGDGRLYGRGRILSGGGGVSIRFDF